MLPGYRSLEAELNARCSSYSSIERDVEPEHHFLRAGRWLRKESYTEVSCQTYLGNLRGPLDDEIKQSIVCLFSMLWGDRIEQANKTLRAEYQRLREPDSTECILDDEDYCGFYTITLIRGSSPTR